MPFSWATRQASHLFLGDQLLLHVSFRHLQTLPLSYGLPQLYPPHHRTDRRLSGLTSNGSAILEGKGWAVLLVACGRGVVRKHWRGDGQADGDAGDVAPRMKIERARSGARLVLLEDTMGRLKVLTGARGESFSSPRGKSVSTLIPRSNPFSSLDQTTRVHGAIPGPDGTAFSWHELSRPQIHGYDILGVTFLDTLRFVSIADEKVARVFEAPRGFIDVVEGLGVAKFSPNEVSFFLRVAFASCLISLHRSMKDQLEQVYLPLACQTRRSVKVSST